MNTQAMLKVIEAEIAKLQRAAAALRGSTSGGTRKRTAMSAEGRAKIAASQKARWKKWRDAQKGKAKKKSS